MATRFLRPCAGGAADVCAVPVACAGRGEAALTLVPARQMKTDNANKHTPWFFMRPLFEDRINHPSGLSPEANSGCNSCQLKVCPVSAGIYPSNAVVLNEKGVLVGGLLLVNLL